jgi:hypothetical protein
MNQGICSTGVCGSLAALGCSYLAAFLTFLMTSGWSALLASALLFAHPFSLWDALRPDCARACRALVAATALLADLMLVASLGGEGLEGVAPWQAFVWTELAVCALPLLLDCLAEHGRAWFVRRRSARATGRPAHAWPHSERIPSSV